MVERDPSATPSGPRSAGRSAGPAAAVGPEIDAGPPPVAAEAPDIGTHRRPRRSDATRAAILAAARDRFAADGYERATIRAIARDAGIDPSMVMRYYGNKEGLFAAAAEIDLRVPDLAALPPEERGARLVRHFIELWEGDETLTGMLRVGATNDAGAECIRRIFAEQARPMIDAACPVPEEAAARAALIESQILGMALCRYVLRVPPAVDLGHDELVAWLAPTIQRYLTAERP
ncbi:TetR family transcriptional regulator [Streptomyces noursei]|uniref:TetR/AcrR family transcriptional regulator n=1 Tax=Streptomyces noursei TaxID=1971 RepID=UPI000A4D84D0|nr:TetR family transcriptional regulator [Streptomyces noursei]